MSARPSNGKRRQNGANPVAPAERDAPDGAISPKAKCRDHIMRRLESPQDYARFAAAAGSDILIGGESVKRFAEVNKLDETHLRHRAQVLRERVFAAALQANVAAIQ